MMLRERVDILIPYHLPLQQSVNIREYVQFLVFHVHPDLMRIRVVQLHDESCQVILLIQCLLQLLADIRQLEIQVVFV